MKHLIRNTLVTILGIGLVGCEWGGGGDDNSWSDSNSLANFNGNYRANGGYLVSDYTVSTSTTASGGGVNVSNENKGNVPGASFAGQCNLTPVKPGSFHLFITGGVDGQVTDDGSGVLSGTFNVPSSGITFPASGTINYDNGAYGLNLGANGVLVLGKAVTITYTVLSEGGATTTTSSGTPGSSKIKIYTFNVQQTGNKLTIIDNNGSVYKGSFGDVKTTGNLSSTSGGAEFVNGDQVIGSFSASGTSAAGIHVNMTGTFQGTAAGVTKVSTRSGDTVTYTTSMALTDRQIMGTWIEDGGKTGNISGYCPSAVNVSSGTTTETTTL